MHFIPIEFPTVIFQLLCTYIFYYLILINIITYIQKTSFIELLNAS